MTAWARTSPLADQLFDEWNATHGHSTHLFGALGELTGEEAVQLIRQPQSKESRDAILLTLLTLEHDGDTFAGRVLLKSFMPLALRLPSSCSSTRDLWRHSPADARTATIGVLWEVLHNYPLHREANVSGNIRLETIKLLDRSYGNKLDEISVDDDTLEYLVNEDDVYAGDDTFRDLVTILTWAIDSETLRRDEVQLLARIELAEGDPRDARKLAADELGISRETLNRRVSRIRTKLMHAVCGDVQATVAYAPRRS